MNGRSRRRVLLHQALQGFRNLMDGMGWQDLKSLRQLLVGNGDLALRDVLEECTHPFIALAVGPALAQTPPAGTPTRIRGTVDKHSGELRRSDRSVRKARNGNPSSSRCRSSWSNPRHEAIKFNGAESMVRYLGIAVNDALAIANRLTV